MKDFIQKNCILKGNFTLSSGVMSDIYFDIRKATLNSVFLKKLFQHIKTHILLDNPDINIIGGPSVGADFITAGILGIAKGAELRGSIYRKPKQHGTGATIENLITDGDRNILVVDDVITTGSSLDLACSAFLDAGYNIKCICAIINRGGDKVTGRLREKFNCPTFSIFEN